MVTPADLEAGRVDQAALTGVVLDTSAARLRRLAAPGIASGPTDATKASDETEKYT